MNTPRPDASHTSPLESRGGVLRKSAFEYLKAGLCVLPARAEIKMPAVDEWKPYTERLPSESEIDKMFDSRTQRLCIICGKVSGNVEVLDFDLSGVSYPEWRNLVEEKCPWLIERLFIETSPSGGFHAVYKCVEPPGRSTKLAMRHIRVDGPDDVEYEGKKYKTRKDGDGYYFEPTLIEIKGEGGLILCAPSPMYEAIQGNLTELNTVTTDERNVMVSCARSLDERPLDQRTEEGFQQPKRSTRKDGELRPGDDFNHRGDIRPYLIKHGWRLVRGGENEHWCRPGKDKGTSATLKNNVFYNFSSNASPFEPDRAYSPFAVYALLEHNGDFAAAAKALVGEGFGSQMKLQARSERHEQDDEEYPVPLGQFDPVTGRVVLSTRKTLPTAEAFVRIHYFQGTVRSLHAYAGSFWVWQRNRYVQIDDDSLLAEIFPWLHRALCYQLIRKTGELKLVSFDANPSTAGAALESVKAHAHLSAESPMPSWLDDAPERPPPHEIVVCRNGNLHVPSGKFLGPTPSLWTTCATEFDYDPDAPTPSRWLAFLEETFGGDAASIGLLQEWFGYSLIPDTRQQKALLISGSQRSGKGTVGRVLRALLGASNVVSPTTSSLATKFGLQPLIGKTLAVVSDARFVELTHPRWAPFFEIILCVTGEDAVTIDRKYKEQLTIHLMTRFMFLSNNLPNFAAVSEALASRFLVLQTRGSRYGREDPDLTAKLLMELPGIFLWSIEGWKRLHERVRFVQPDLRESDEDEDPLDAFQGPARRVAKYVSERCDIGRGHRALIDELYGTWCIWVGPRGASDLNKQLFCRYLLEVVPGLKRRRGTNGDGFYDGIGVKGSE